MPPTPTTHSTTPGKIKTYFHQRIGVPAPKADPKPIKRTFYEKPPVPFEDFPLSWHSRGYWRKRYGGVEYRYEYDPIKSLERWLIDKKKIDQGEDTSAPRKRHTLADAINRMLTRQMQRHANGEIGDRQFVKWRKELQRELPQAVSVNTPLDAFRARNPSDSSPSTLFRQIKAKAMARGLFAADRHIRYVRAALNYAVEKRIALPVDYGDDFDPPPQDQLDDARLERDVREGRSWTPDELRKIIAGARRLREDRRTRVGNRLKKNHHLHAQVLLALFAGFGSDDISAMPESAINFETGVVKYKRVKVRAMPTEAILPKAVLTSIRWSMKHRAPPCDPAYAHLLFRNENGKAFNVFPRHRDASGLLERVGANDGIQRNFKYTLGKLGLLKPRTGFKTLRAMCRSMLVNGNIHPDVCDRIMGRPTRNKSDETYLRGDLSAEMLRASKYLEKELLAPAKKTRGKR